MPDPILFINPGTDWYPDQHSPEAAARNLAVFLREVPAVKEVKVEPLIEPTETEAKLLMGGTRYQETHDGRYPFRVTLDGVKHVIEMPGLGLDEVRYVKSEGQNIWDFPRLFIDGSSWVWFYALGVLDGTEDYR